MWRVISNRFWSLLRRFGSTIWGRVTIVALVLLVLTFGAVVMALAVQIHIYGGVDGAAAADVIIVLGGGVDPDGGSSEAMTRRAKHGADLYHSGYAPAVICSGGYAPPGVAVVEADACAEVLLAEAVPPAAIWREPDSHSTEENAIFSGRLMQAQGWQTALVTSDRYHLWRASLLFQKHGIVLAGMSPAQASAAAIDLLEYLSAVRREVMAVFWQVGKDDLGLPLTHVPIA